MDVDNTFIWGTGRRKTAVARVRLSRGTGSIKVNNRAFENYFTCERDRVAALASLQMTKTLGKYDILANIHGGGVSSQAGALLLGISRALKIAEPALDPRLKKEKMLTRDPRMKERKKYGLRGARRGTQFSKR
ncbi:MAG: 30S ribosomal protein S9 [Planctomycetes bacterium RBG_16_59_8]|nr:MAG: 30S ribosomal protein S9 [Planctomycetes bacterium RBG_16_59_8]